MAIKVTINGKEETIEDNMTAAKLLDTKKVRPEVVTVELNDEIIHREKYDSVKIKQNDKIEFLYYMGGGLSFSFRRKSRFMTQPYITLSE